VTDRRNRFGVRAKTTRKKRKKTTAIINECPGKGGGLFPLLHVLIGRRGGEKRSPGVFLMACHQGGKGEAFFWTSTFKRGERVGGPDFGTFCASPPLPGKEKEGGSHFFSCAHREKKKKRVGPIQTMRPTEKMKTRKKEKKELDFPVVFSRAVEVFPLNICSG